MGKVNGKWEHDGGLATFEVFKKNKEERYFKFVVTDEEMRQISNEFIDVTPENINVLAYVDDGKGDWDWRPISGHPFTFTSVANESDMLKISYDRSKDKYGPLYMLEYTGNNGYLNSEGSKTTVAVYTRKLIDIFNWDNMRGGNDNHWRYGAYLEKHPCSENDNVKDNKDCDVKNAVVELPKDLFGSGNNQIEIVKDETELGIETDFATINFDDKVLQQIDNENNDVTLDVKTLEDEDKNSTEYAGAKNGFKDAEAIIDLKLYDGESGTISEFDGTVTVYWEYELQDTTKTPKVYYVKADGTKEEMKCEYDAEHDVIIFTTNHFSLFAIEEVAKTSSTGGGGGAVAVTPDVTTDTSASTTTSKTDVKLSESTDANGTTESTAIVTVSTTNQNEILKQVKKNNSKEIVLTVSENAVKNATSAEVQLEKSFVEAVAATGASLTVKTPFGDKTYTNAELKALAAAADGKTVNITIEKTEEKTDAEKAEQAQAGAAKAAMKARSGKTAKGNIKVVFRPDEETENFIKEMKALGYTVKYRYYRSTKKSSAYKAMLTKSGRTYINTSGKRGTRYYYKVQVLVYDANGKLVAKTALKQCKYATRQWTK